MNALNSFFFKMSDVAKRKVALVACCLSNLYGFYAPLQIFLNFWIMYKQQKRNKIIQKTILITHFKIFQKEG